MCCDVCPHCGKCKRCGGYRYQPYPYWPYQPYFQPYTYPYTTTTGGLGQVQGGLSTAQGQGLGSLEPNQTCENRKP